MADPNDPLDGTSYRATGRRLGKGGAGEVYEAEHRTLGRRVAVKLLHTHLDHAGMQERFELEARALAQLSHPNIVEVFDLGLTAERRPFFVMPLLEGRSLEAEVRARDEIPLPEARRLMLQLLDALGALHAHGLVHRDIKPANLFLTEGPPARLKVLDLGVMKVWETTRMAGPSLPTRPGVVVGSPRFMSPEQARGKPVSPRTDLYAAGLVLYRLVAGRGPFDDRQSLPDMLIAQASEAPSPPSLFARQSLPPELDFLVLRAIEKDPGDRFDSAAAFTAALQNLALDLSGESATPFDPFRQAPALGGGLAATVPMGPATEILRSAETRAITEPLEERELGPGGTAPLDPRTKP